MSTPETFAKSLPVEKHIVFPDPPEDPDDKMTSFDRLAANGNVYLLIEHLGSPETTLVAGEHYLALAPTRNLAGVRYPDLLVAFGADPQAYRASNAYVISEQGKPPDWILEVVSPSSGRTDRVDKRVDYARLGIGEYWRFDERGRSSEARLAGDRLVGDEYEPVEIEELPDGVLQGYSPALNLHLRWEEGELVFHDPATGAPIASLESERDRADSEWARANAAEERSDAERAARLAAEARIRELEAQLGLTQ